MDDTPKKNPWGLVCVTYLMSSRVGLGDWHSPFWGFHLRDRRLTVVLSTLTLGLRDSWRGAAVLAGALPWGLMGERDGVEG